MSHLVIYLAHTIKHSNFFFHRIFFFQLEFDFWIPILNFQEVHWDITRKPCNSHQKRTNPMFLYFITPSSPLMNKPISNFEQTLVLTGLTTENQLKAISLENGKPVNRSMEKRKKVHSSLRIWCLHTFLISAFTNHSQQSY